MKKVTLTLKVNIPNLVNIIKVKKFQDLKKPMNKDSNTEKPRNNFLN